MRAREQLGPSVPTATKVAALAIRAAFDSRTRGQVDAMAAKASAEIETVTIPASPAPPRFVNLALHVREKWAWRSHCARVPRRSGNATRVRTASVGGRGGSTAGVNPKHVEMKLAERECPLSHSAIVARAC